MAERLREASGFEYIVVADEDGIRHSHPVEDAIGQPSSIDASSVLAYSEWTGVERGLPDSHSGRGHPYGARTAR
ncbi:hypothetical protein [Nesterenkonia pannonica]|uniref:hypothetical protein n=1 Tax=Nesterenkonia pannonica TaxID=1548602 RepID=UPI0021641E51|nr:hypothetical protein [Nesterenkonia pannonica]